MTRNETIKTVAVIGGGVTGIVAAYLLSRRFQVTLFETNNYLGGHTNTRFVAMGQDRDVPVDTGFIVFNHKTYPLFTEFLKQLDVDIIDAPMSFSYHRPDRGIQFASHIPSGLFADKKNAFRPWFWRMLWDILRFNRKGRGDLATGIPADMTLGRYLAENRFSKAFCDYYLLPMAAAIWSSGTGKIVDFPCKSFLRFYDNHGLLSVADQPQWKTLKNGSIQYVKAFTRAFAGEIRLNEEVQQIQRNNNGVAVTTSHGQEHTFDAAVIAAHADQALAMLTDPDEREQAVLGAWTYSTNTTVLHSDAGHMPPLKNAWASWNYLDDAGPGASDVALTYYMNMLQRLPATNNYFVSLNARRTIDPALVHYLVDYTHPRYDTAALKTQQQLPLIRRDRNTYFCGSYCGYGFHEDGVRAAVAVGKEFGISL
ncbi:MAG: FAD-dependent oxidoreductase [Thermodesulfobacteriota bacterium]|nr:FAD-dependent oxidoreductase [Thermodesulfobacteriota bacterium]